MDQKMKNFDRNIEQLMNQNAVAPPFGAWNRIAAELDAEVAVVGTVAAASAPAQRSVAGMMISAMIIGASFVTAYFVNSNSLQQPVANSTTITAPAEIAPAVNNLPVTQLPVEKPEAKQVAVAIRSAKPHTIAKPVEATINPADEATSVAAHTGLPAGAEVSVPLIATDKNTATADAYYFPAVDMYSGENKMAEPKPVSKIAKTEKAPEREVTASSEPRLKFRPKKHNSYRYGKINRTHSRRK